MVITLDCNSNNCMLTLTLQSYLPHRDQFVFETKVGASKKEEFFLYKNDWNS